MKLRTISYFLCILFCINSCTTTIVSSTKANDINSVLSIGKTYSFIKKDGTKIRFKVEDINENTIIGRNIEYQRFEIEKNQIAEIKKGNTLGTVLIAAGVVASAIIIPAYVSNKPIGQ